MTMNKSENHTMMDTAGISPQQNNIGLGLFYVAYIIFEIPSNLIMAHVNPSYWIARIMVTWSVVTGCMTAISHPWHFYLLRFLLGLFEAGLWPGITFYTTLWYKEDEISTRIGVTYLAAPTSGAIGGLISAAVQLIDTRGNLFGWQWLFVIFGILTFIFGLATIWVLPSTPERSTKFLNEHERFAIQKRLKEHDKNNMMTSPTLSTVGTGYLRTTTLMNTGSSPTQQELATENTQKITAKRVIREFKDAKNWFFVVLYFTPVMAATSLGYFLPKIVEQMGEFDAIHVSLMSIPPYVFGMVMVYIINKLSDRYQTRGWYIMGGCCVSFIGFCILSFAESIGARYFGLMIIAGGTYPTVPLSMAWTANSKEDAVSVATATGIVSSIANFGALICTFALYSGWPADGPRYVGSNMINGGAMLFAAVCAFVLRLHLSKLNTKMKKKRVSGISVNIPMKIGEKTYPYIL
ncbi:major facilitator superfamily domain-containing protein [Mycotypha africana]|uniref:major facilitator superfamily domain-containing protein n=1 Tax=Mycotypha africana TaxID=64632 RepID=UPI0023019BC0|nr:major facilitator superfamily domain-containing protein [Mycotypha africana]KAI8987481.1 major facilitator superfamily domain-containing protein [Mycotypha africana]